MEVGVTTPEQRQPSDRRGHPADRCVFVVPSDVWDAMATALDGTARDVPGLPELMSTPTGLDR